MGNWVFRRPWKYSRLRKRRRLSAPEAAGTFTATSALTAGGAEFSASATFTPPVYSATAALEAPGATIAATSTAMPCCSFTTSVSMPAGVSTLAITRAMRSRLSA